LSIDEYCTNAQVILQTDDIMKIGEKEPLDIDLLPDIVSTVCNTINYCNDFSEKIAILFKKPFSAEGERVQSYSGGDLYLRQLVTLKPKQWLCDEVINMYGALLMEHYVHKNMIIFSTQFSNFLNNLVLKEVLTTAQKQKGAKDEYIVGEYNYDLLKRFKNGIIDKRDNPLNRLDIIYIPVLYHGHWILFILDLKKNLVCLNNSLDGYAEDDLHEVMRRVFLYVVDAGLMSTEAVQFEKVAVPQQDNGFDCGLFTINFLRKALADKENFPDSFDFSRLDMAVDLLSLKINTNTF
jgi:Ulp1 family protease